MACETFVSTTPNNRSGNTTVDITSVYESEQRLFSKQYFMSDESVFTSHLPWHVGFKGKDSMTGPCHHETEMIWSFPNRLIMLARHMHQLTIPCITWLLALPQRKTSHMAMLMLMSSLQPIQNYSIHNHFQQLPATGVTMINIAWLLCWSLQWYAVKFYRTSKWAEEKSIPLSLCNQAYINNKHRQPGRSTRYSAVTQQLH